MKTGKVDLNVITENNYYCQITQTSDIKWSFLQRTGPKSFKELFLSVLCREYFGDAVVCANLDIDVPQIYGFKLVDKRISIEETLLSVSMHKSSVPNFMNHLKLLRTIEKKMGIKMTRKYSTQFVGENETKLVLIGDKKWVSSPLLISIYTLIIRSLSYETSTSSFKAHINELISRHNGNDSSAFRIFSEKKFDLIHLLLNIDEVLGTNPLTGSEDVELASNKSYITDQHKEVCLNYKRLDTRKSRTMWTISGNHGSHGIVNFVCNLGYRESSGTAVQYAYNCIGESWTDNYSALRKREKELIDSLVVQPVPTESFNASVVFSAS